MDYTKEDLELAHKVCEQHKRRVHGSIWLEEWAYLYRTVIDYKPKSILEIGSFHHLSSTAFLKGLEDNTEGYLLSLDIMFPEPEFEYPGAEWIKLEISSFDILPKLRNKFDLIFIDGAHGVEAVTKDVENSLKIISENGIILMHDTNYPPTRKAIELVLGDKVEYWSYRDDKFHGIGLFKNTI